MVHLRSCADQGFVNGLCCGCFTIQQQNHHGLSNFKVRASFTRRQMGDCILKSKQLVWAGPVRYTLENYGVMYFLHSSTFSGGVWTSGFADLSSPYTRFTCGLSIIRTWKYCPTIAYNLYKSRSVYLSNLQFNFTLMYLCIQVGTSGARMPLIPSASDVRGT
jgi:hypothetical protein